MTRAITPQQHGSIPVNASEYCRLAPFCLGCSAVSYQHETPPGRIAVTDGRRTNAYLNMFAVA